VTDYVASDVVRISVKNLVEYTLRSGDIDTRFVGTSRAVEGTRIHQKLQKAGGDKYLAEAQLKYEMKYKEFLFLVEGRADGIIIEDQQVVIDEIKTTAVPLERIDEKFNPLHWAQAKCYGLIYGEQNNVEQLEIQLTYYNIDTDEIKRLRETVTLQELQTFFCGLLDTYLVWARHLKEWNLLRDASIKNLKFPFAAYRQGQRELAVSVYKIISDNKKLFVQAPTGIGKTISTLFPAVKAMGENKTSKIFYLTAKTITRQVAEEAVNAMRECGLDFKSITLTAKDKICFQEKAICNPDHCEYAKGHFDRVNDAIIDVFVKERAFTREVIEAYSRTYTVCPFELSLDLSMWADCIICDYNYVFDPRVYLKRFFQTSQGDYTFLIDEAHNLVDRAREMFSAELTKSSFLKVKNLYKGHSIGKTLGKINTVMLGMRKECPEEGYYTQLQQPEEIYPLLWTFVNKAPALLTDNHKAEGYDALLELYFNVLIFLKMVELYDDHYVTYVEKSSSEVTLKLFCLDPSKLLGEAVKRGKSSVFFSATLAPLDYFCEILGGEAMDTKIAFPSPFKTENLCLLVADGISTKFKERESSYGEIAHYIHLVIQQKTGNYLIFFPSYHYMQEVHHVFAELYPDTETMIQTNVMSEEEREHFLDRFQPDRDRMLVGFCVLGGIFSEGIDLKGDKLLGTVIIGVGLPQICIERNLIMEHFKKKNELGYEYAYMYPGMNKVLQAAGRVIRSEEDKGVVLLIDARFSSYHYKKLFPAHWRYPREVRSGNKLNALIQAFWDT
jgi:DNA excision repair protein ERCC-2